MSSLLLCLLPNLANTDFANSHKTSHVTSWSCITNEFVSSVLGMLALVALIVISIFQSRIVESIILGSAVMDEYKFVNQSTPPACVKAYSLPPAYPDQINFQPPTLPQNWGDKGAEGKQNLAAQMTAWITMILIIITLLAILYAIQVGNG